MSSEEYTGVQKAAILLIALGPEKSASIFKYLKEDEIEELTLEIANTRSVSPQTKEDILNELGFSLVYGISSDYGCADVNRMVSLARRNMEAFRRNNICKGIKSY